MEEDDETLCKYGTPLPAYEEDEIPSKKPVSVEDQIVLDVNGKRRFHGAFTGGFSAGYWNTVGSEEGWTPTEFKSSRGEKATGRRTQTAMDFMDEEDLGEFGIAPQRVQTREDFAAAGSSKKRKGVSMPSGGPIPGQPVLKALLEPAREKTAVRMLKRMGWREGQGIGERQSRGEKKKAKDRNRKETYLMKMYGCEIPGRSAPAPEDGSESDDDGSEDEDYEVSFAPDDFDPLVAAIKDNTFGLGYSGLDRGSSGSGAKRFNLFETLEIVDRNNKKLSIRGQAFGVGALEDDDEDIYEKDDMSRYDFSLEDRTKKPAAIKSAEQAGVLEGFCASKKTGKQIKKVFKVKMPENFAPRNWAQRKSRFEPMEEGRAVQLAESNQYRVQELGRHDLNPEQRGQALGEVPIVAKEPPKNPILEMINSRAQNFVSGEVINVDQDRLEPPKKDPLKFDLKAETSNLGSTREGFKPFIADPDKQERYEKFLSFKPCERYSTKEDFLSSLQPLGMSSWDREREFKEFVQAQRMYRPLDGLMSDRFVTESSIIAEKEVSEAGKSVEVRVKRTRGLWKPHKDLCKRFNVPEPFGGMLEEEKATPKTKFSVFDYLETPVNTRKDFVTPSVIPKQTEPKAQPVRASAKDFFAAPPPQREEPSTSRPKPPPPPPPPKKPEKLTPLEQQVLDAVNKKPEEKQDLFKSIFCSSSDDEEDVEDQPPPEPTPTPANPTPSEAEKLKLVESLVAIKPASQVNVLRNDSPPRGIFASILDIQKSKEAQKPQSLDSSSSSGSDEETEYYGPKLPQGTKVVVAETGSAERREESELDARLKEMIRKVGGGSSRRGVVEEWVEKGKEEGGGSGSGRSKKKKKHKEHKKSKKHKKEKKKHKHKDRK